MSRFSACEEAYVEGFAAYEAEARPDANPYPVEDEEHDAWVAGWEKAQALHDRARSDVC